MTNHYFFCQLRTSTHRRLGPKELNKAFFERGNTKLPVSTNAFYGSRQPTRQNRSDVMRAPIFIMMSLDVNIFIIIKAHRNTKPTIT